MKRTLLFTTALLLAACNPASDISDQSSRPPKGNPDATVVVTEFADLQCPACRAAHTSITQPILEEYGDHIRFEFMHFPLRSIHRFALDAAEASECAADQGKFWPFVDLAFEEQPNLSHETLLVWAEQLQLDVDLFERCWKSDRKRDIVLSDYAKGRDMDVNGTPSYFVNGVRVESGFDTIGAAIEEQLENAMMPL